MRIRSILAVPALLAACAGSAYLPGVPGSPSSDISGSDVRSAWLAEHPEVDEQTRAAIAAGVFKSGMTLEQRDVITNPDRRDSTGDGFWRSRAVGDETRYQWFIGGERQPFEDGNGQLVCELIYVDGTLEEIRFCGAVSG